MYVDLRGASLQRVTSKRSTALDHEIRKLAEQVNRMIDDAPEFDPSWLALSEGLYGAVE
jgi:hypothetical protein